ncbi:MAG: pentapeptide repeat-containing protein, partial [bacterium]|nr:pentapeptide repeat-containing protein [bacterium]
MTFTAHKVLLRRSLGRRVTSALIVLSLLLVPLAAIADLLSEIAAGDTDHRAHDHSEEVITWEFIAEIDATGANFSGVTFDDTRITLSDFTDVDFSDSSGTTTSFRRTTVRGGVFDGATLEDADLTDTQFRCIIDPDETTPGGKTTLCPSFIGTDFTGADLTSTVFGPIFTTDKLVFSGATFDDADLTDAILAAVAEPCLQTNEVTNEWTCLSFGGDPNPVLPDTTNPATVAGMTFLNASDLRGSNLQDLSFDHGAFSDALLAGTQFEKSAFVDTTFYSADTTCEVLDASATAAELDAETDLCNFLTDNATIKTNFQDTTFTDVNFAEAKLGNATFGDGADGDSDGASFADVDFSAATLAGTDFTNATLADVVPDATFTDAVFDDALLGCTDDPESEAFADDCDDCAIFTGFLDSIPSPVDGVYKIRMRNIDFSNILACSALREDGGDDPLIDDLSQLDLDGAEFFQTDLSAVNFVESSLVAANLSQSTLSSLNFDDAILDAAIAIDSDFVSATFGDHDTDGTGTSLVGATLDSSQFDSATFTNATLAGATARCLPDGDETVCASFNSAVFTNSDLSNVDFTSADLLGTIFQGGSDLSSADFSEAKFDGVTSFAGSQIDGLDLRDVDLQSASPSLFQGKLA